jgi:predicted DsbA family dithiol-disulfide isomerase
VVAFLGLGVLAMLRGDIGRRLYTLAAGAVGVAGAGFILLQGYLGAFCIFCVITDSSSVIIALVALSRHSWDPPAVSASARREVGAVALALSFLVPLAVAAFKRPIVPPVIAEELAKAPKGQVVVVDFADFECPFCRMTHEELEPLLEAHKGQVKVVRELVPLTRIHRHALDAARAACCGELLGKGDAMANALFSAPVEELTVPGCEQIALTLGLDLTAYRACIADPRTDARIHADRETFDKATVKGDGLPLIWIGEHKLMGAQDRAALQRALDQAIARVGS